MSDIDCLRCAGSGYVINVDTGEVEPCLDCNAWSIGDCPEVEK